MKALFLAFPLMAICLSGCEAINNLNNSINESTYSINSNREAVQSSTYSIHQNTRTIQESNRSIAENRSLLEAELKK
jgi:peptidoglycan hydrolase CwlO-like protein